MSQTEKLNTKFENRIQSIREMLMAFQSKREEACSVLDDELKKLDLHIEVATPLYNYFMLHYILVKKNREGKHIFSLYYTSCSHFSRFPTKS